MASPRYSPRSFRGPLDLQSMLDIITMRSPERINSYPSMIDLREISGTLAGQSTMQLWEETNGAIVAFALLDDPFFAFEISPGAPFDELAGQMIAWGAKKLTSTNTLPEPPEALVTGCREADTQRIDFLEQHGFSAQPIRALHFMRSLSSPIPAPQLPEGFRIRPIAGEAEAAAWIQLHHAAHENHDMTIEFRLAMMRTAEYEQGLDLVAVAPGGRLAAYVMGHFSSEENQLRQQKIGYTDPVATHPDFQGQGLARALLYASFKRLKEFGMEFAEVSTWGENVGMIKTAESVGYRCYSTTIFFNRSLKMLS